MSITFTPCIQPVISAESTTEITAFELLEIVRSSAAINPTKNITPAQTNSLRSHVLYTIELT